MLTGKVLDEGEGGIEGTLRAMVRRLGEPVIRTAVSAAMREMGEQFVLGRTIEEAVRARPADDSPRAISIPTTCSARRRAPRPTRCATTMPMPTRSRR